MLWTELLRPGELGVIDASTKGSWSELEARLRPFVAKRVGGEANVEDVIQEVFIRMQRGLQDLRDDERFGPWVYRVARNAIADHHRAAARHPLANESPPQEHAPDPRETSPDDEGAAARELARYIVPFVAMLPSPYRKALTLTELEGLTQKEAAAMVGISVSGMKSRVQRGRQKLRQSLEDCCHIAVDARHKVLGFEPRKDGKLPDGCCP